MKKISICLSFLVVSFIITTPIFSQDTALDVNSLATPNSPGATLLGENPSDIQKPTDLNGIMMAVRNATNDFSKFPTSFSIDISPWWLVGAKNISYKDFISNKKTIAQTFNFSYAQNSQNDSNYNGLKQGIGFSFSLARGSIRDKKFIGKVDSIKSILNELLNANYKQLQLLRQNDSDYQMLKLQHDSIQLLLKNLRNSVDSASVNIKNNLLKDLININLMMTIKEETFTQQAKDFVDNLQNEKINTLKELEQPIVPVRKGFFLNVAAGTIIKYDNFKVRSSSLTNNSLWLNVGFDGFKTDSTDKSHFSIIALSRFIANNADELYKSGNSEKHTTWDNGLKLAFTTADQKFSLSGEAIRRDFLKINTGQTFVYKYVFNIDWAVAKNARLTLSYGRDFSNHLTKDGNVIGFINFVKGLFNKKPISNNSSNQ